MGSRRPSLNDQLDAAMAALEVSGDWYPQLMDAERSYAEQPLAVPTNLGDLRKDQLIGEGGYSLVWLVSLGPERYALKQMHKAELASRRGLGPEVAFREKVLHPPASLSTPRCLPLYTPRPPSLHPPASLSTPPRRPSLLLLRWPTRRSSPTR